ncbi:MAG: transposase, partial [Thermotogae bacterium]
MESKVQVIRKAIQETRQRRKNQKVVVYQLKLQNLSKRKQELLARVFAEAKWLYNYLVSDISRLNVPANKISTVQ